MPVLRARNARIPDYVNDLRRRVHQYPDVYEQLNEVELISTGNMLPMQVLPPGPVFGSRACSRRNLFRRRFVAIAIAACSDNYYKLLGEQDLIKESYFWEIAAMIEHVRLEQPFDENLLWKQQIPTIAARVPNGPYSLTSLYVPFCHDLILDQPSFIFVRNTALTEEQFQQSQVGIISRVNQMKTDFYLFKSLEKLTWDSVNNAGRTRVEDLRGNFQHEYYIEDQVEQLGAIFTNSMFCYVCTKALSGPQGALSHLYAFHRDKLDASKYERQKNDAENRAIQQSEANNLDTIESCRRHHSEFHPDCNVEL